MAALLSLADYKALTNIPTTDTSRDTQISAMLDAVSMALRRFCGRSTANGFESTSRTETYSGNDEEAIFLAEWPVTSITSVSLIDDDGNSTALATTGEYRVDADTGALYRLGACLTRFAAVTEWSRDPAGRFGISPNWPYGIKNISVVYTGGYSTIPDDLEWAVAQVMDRALANAGANTAMQSESIGSYSYSRLADESVKSMAALIRGCASAWRGSVL